MKRMHAVSHDYFFVETARIGFSMSSGHAGFSTSRDAVIVNFVPSLLTTVFARHEWTTGPRL